MKMKIFGILLMAGFAVFAALSLSCVKTRPNKFAQQDWQPNLDQSISQLEEILATLEQQQPKNYTIANLSSLYDAKLYLLFQNHLASLSDKVRAGEVERQRQWLEQRKKVVDAAYEEYEGGTLASFNAGQASIKMTKERIKKIEGK